jgi:hypothetical protein
MSDRIVDRIEKVLLVLIKSVLIDYACKTLIGIVDKLYAGKI